VPKAANSLLSIGLFDASGSTAIISEGAMALHANGVKIAKAEQRDGLYIFHATARKTENWCQIAQNKKDTWGNWHE
jgi:hypothetical protein